MSNKLRQSKLLKLHLLAMDYLLEIQSEQAEVEEKVDEELMYARVFFMGLTAGVVLEKTSLTK